MLLREGHAFAKSLAEYKRCWCVIYRHQAEAKSDTLRDAWEKRLREQDVPKSHYWRLLFHIRCVAITPSEQALCQPQSQWFALAGSLLGMVLDEEEKVPGDVFLAQISFIPALQTWPDFLSFKFLSSYWCNIDVSWLGGLRPWAADKSPQPLGSFHQKLCRALYGELFLKFGNRP